MNQTTSPAAVHFCYKCGRRLSPGVEQCWYCGARTQRAIRPARLCPFCREAVRHGAVKCPHCGEFLDGRERSAAPPQIVFVVDGRLLGGRAPGGGLAPGGELRLPSGQPVPPAIAAALSPRTVEAIETGRPSLIEERGVRVLPAPSAGDERSISDAAAISDAEPVSGAKPPAGAGLPVRAEPRAPSLRGAAGAPAARPLPPVLSAGLALGRALGRLFGKPSPVPPDADTALEADIDARYRICENCQTEILATDNYCFNCGFQYHKPTPAEVLGVAPGPRRSNALLYGIAAVLIATLAATKSSRLSVDLPTSAGTVLASLAGLGLIAAFFRRRSFMNQAAAIVMILLTLVVYFLL